MLLHARSEMQNKFKQSSPIWPISLSHMSNIYTIYMGFISCHDPSKSYKGPRIIYINIYIFIIDDKPESFIYLFNIYSWVKTEKVFVNGFNDTTYMINDKTLQVSGCLDAQQLLQFLASGTHLKTPRTNCSQLK